MLIFDESLLAQPILYRDPKCGSINKYFFINWEDSIDSIFYVRKVDSFYNDFHPVYMAFSLFISVDGF